jgi:acyl-CoA thioesterase I
MKGPSPAETHLRRAGIAVLAAALSTPAFGATTRILCIGDSITQGGRKDRDESTYRVPLQAMLINARIDYDFVGTRRAGLDADAAWPAWFDPDHEGYYGATTAEVRDRLQAHLRALPKPDVALVALGTNDHRHSFVEPLESIVGLLRAKNPRVTILVGQTAFDGWTARWQHFQVSRMAARLDTGRSPVITVDLQDGWEPDPKKQGADTYDWVHPNRKGQHTMARRWFVAMLPHLKPVRLNAPP